MLTAPEQIVEGQATAFDLTFSNTARGADAVYGVEVIGAALCDRDEGNCISLPFSVASAQKHDGLALQVSVVPVKLDSDPRKMVKITIKIAWKTRRSSSRDAVLRQDTWPDEGAERQSVEILERRAIVTFGPDNVPRPPVFKILAGVLAVLLLVIAFAVMYNRCKSKTRLMALVHKHRLSQELHRHRHEEVIIVSSHPPMPTVAPSMPTVADDAVLV